MNLSSLKPTRWEPIVMSALGAAVAQIDPADPARTIVIVAVKAGIGAAVGAYFGNHISTRRRKL